jgi:hypothetical protein
MQVSSDKNNRDDTIMLHFYCLSLIFYGTVVRKAFNNIDDKKLYNKKPSLSSLKGWVLKKQKRKPMLLILF